MLNKDDIKIIGFEGFWRNGKWHKRVVYKLKDDVRLKDLEIDAEKEYTEDELKKLICEVMQNE